MSQVEVMKPHGLSPTSCTTRWVGKISTPGRAGRDEHGEGVRRRRLLLPVGDRGLVAVVPVGDQKRALRGRSRRAEAPDPRADAAVGDVHQGIAARALRRGRRRRRAGRSARAGSWSRGGSRAARPWGPRGSARGGAPCPPSTASPRSSRRSPRGCAPRRRGRRSPGRSTRGRARPREARRARARRRALARRLGRVRPGEVDDVVVVRVPEGVEVVLVDHVIGRSDEVVATGRRPPRRSGGRERARPLVTP